MELRLNTLNGFGKTCSYLARRKNSLSAVQLSMSLIKIIIMVYVSAASVKEENCNIVTVFLLKLKTHISGEIGIELFL